MGTKQMYGRLLYIMLIIIVDNITTEQYCFSIFKMKQVVAVLFLKNVIF